MLLLIIGVLLWSLVHWSRALCVDERRKVIDKIGEGRYKLIFSALIVASLLLMVWGWKSATPELLYNPPAFTRHITALLMVVAVVLFFSGRAPTRIKNFLRHPQLTGLALWGIAHLIANGDSRSVVLFGGLTLWAISEIVLINRRDGDWVKKPTSAKGDLIVAVVSAVFLALFIGGGHLWLFGVRPF